MSRVVSSGKKLISFNILFDAFSTSLLVAGVGFLVLEHPAINPGLTMSMMGLATIVGICASFPAGIVADRLGVRRVLMVVQIAQVLTFFCMWLSSGSLFVYVLSIAFGLGRIVSPLRGALPPIYIAKEELIVFKSILRTWTLLVVLVGSALISLIVFSGVSLRGMVSFIGVVSYFICFITTVLLGSCNPKGGYDSERSDGSLGMTPKDWLLWVSLLGAFSVVGLGDALFSFVVARIGSSFSWLLFVSSVVGIIVNEIMRRRMTRISNSSGRIILLRCMLFLPMELVSYQPFF